MRFTAWRAHPLHPFIISWKKTDGRATSSVPLIIFILMIHISKFLYSLEHPSLYYNLTSLETNSSAIQQIILISQSMLPFSTSTSMWINTICRSQKRWRGRRNNLYSNAGAILRVNWSPFSLYFPKVGSLGGFVWKGVVWGSNDFWKKGFTLTRPSISLDRSVQIARSYLQKYIPDWLFTRFHLLVELPLNHGLGALVGTVVKRPSFTDRHPGDTGWRPRGRGLMNRHVATDRSPTGAEKLVPKLVSSVSSSVWTCSPLQISRMTESDRSRLVVVTLY